VGIDKEERSRVEAIGWTPRPGWLTPPLPQEGEKAQLAQEASQ